jgi:predicted nucleotidyltransferase
MSRRTKRQVIDLLRASADAIRPVPAALLLFGSVARGEARRGSDLDVLAVRPSSVGYDDDSWAEALISWCERAREIAGYPVQMMEAKEAEVPELLRRPGPSVWQAIASEGVVLTGSPLGELASA